MATKGAHKRLMKEYMAIKKNPPDFIIAKPLEKDILEWHYVIRGPPNSPYEGEYHGKVNFPPDYPYKPPAIRMTTPNGRFQTDYRLCLSMSDYHPGTWNPAWSVATILTGLLSFMLEDAPTTGSIKTTTEEKRMYARKSHAWNLSNPKFRDSTWRRLTFFHAWTAVFPDLCTPEPEPMPAVSTSAASDTLTHRTPAGTSSTASIPAGKAAPIPTTDNAAGHPVQRAANDAGAVIREIWQGARSNMWRALLLAVFMYLVVVKIGQRVSRDAV
ncbi:Ubiquitin-conjugating enzyme E2 6 [Borealophlyctis nickersoniae]|nr:Ubiquitin-conjugating enzyme E2 6 [Borealophlyctis nickersoniae]